MPAAKRASPNGSEPLPDRAREQFAEAIAGGASIADAARKAKISKPTSFRWKQDAAIKGRIAHLKAEKEPPSGAPDADAPLNITRNAIIRELWATARQTEVLGARVTALGILTDIYLLRARNIWDLRNGIGWTSDELEYTVKTGLLPPRIGAITGDTTLDDLQSRKVSEPISKKL